MPHADTRAGLVGRRGKYGIRLGIVRSAGVRLIRVDRRGPDLHMGWSVGVRGVGGGVCYRGRLGAAIQMATGFGLCAGAEYVWRLRPALELYGSVRDQALAAGTGEAPSAKH